MTNSYEAIFEVSHGVTRSGIFYDAVSEERLKIEAQSDLVAFQRAHEHTDYLIRRFISNSSGYTTVILQSLKDKSGRQINQIQLVRNNTSANYDLEYILEKVFPYGRLTVKMYWTHHLK